MKIFPYLQSFGFTRTEIKVVLSLTIVLAFGIALRYYAPSNRSAGSPGQRFDYSISDSIFTERSQKSDKPADSTHAARPNAPRVKPSLKTIININRATKSELTQLPGIGEAYAERIVRYRDSHGLFKTVDELGNVKGIGKKKLELIKPFAITK